MSQLNTPTEQASMKVIIPVGEDFDADKYFGAIVSITKDLGDRAPEFREKLSDMMNLEAGLLPDYSQCCAAHNLANQAAADVGPVFQLRTRIDETTGSNLTDRQRHLVITITPIEPRYLMDAHPDFFSENPTQTAGWFRSFMSRVADRASALGGKLLGHSSANTNQAPGVGWANAMMTFAPGCVERWADGQGFDSAHIITIVRSKGQMFAQLDNLTGVAIKAEPAAGAEPIGMAEILERKRKSLAAKQSRSQPQERKTAKHR